MLMQEQMFMNLGNKAIASLLQKGILDITANDKLKKQLKQQDVFGGTGFTLKNPYKIDTHSKENIAIYGLFKLFVKQSKKT